MFDVLNEIDQSLILKISTYLEGFGANDDNRRLNEDNLITLVASKLSGLKDWWSPASHPPRDWPIARKLAILDSVLNLNYNPLQVDAKIAQADMIAGHMRTAFFVPQNRSYIHSGYPSESILAEAALRICDEIEKQNEHKIDLFASILQGESVMGYIDSWAKSRKCWENSSHLSLHGCCQGTTTRERSALVW